ncbi:MAG: ABC transporter permease [Desulfobacteraceae bacterium]|nr:ABC transporter permease [Desulfobacteraceae bacterium]
MDITIAWRNIWRNPRRTAVILIAVVIGIWSMVFMGALMRGVEVGMIDNGISTLTGDLQVHSRNYRNDPIVENSIREPELVHAALSKVLPPGAHSAFRVRLNAVAGNARHSAGVTLVGIDASAEKAVSFIGDAVTDGEYLSESDANGILVGQELLETFDTRLGRKIILMAQDADGEIASKAFRIKGIFQAEMKATEKQFVFVSGSAARKMLKMGNQVSEVCVALPGHRNSEAVVADLRRELGTGGEFEVNTWRELLPVLNAYLEMSNSFIFIWYVVMFVAMGFGLTNTTLMAVFERMREFGLLKALGMRPARIIRQVLIESSIILMIGMVIGNLLGILSVLLLSNTGIDLSDLAAGVEYAGMSRMIYPVLLESDILVSNLVVFVLGALVSLYPASKAARFTPIQAMAQT